MLAGKKMPPPPPLLSYFPLPEGEEALLQARVTDSTGYIQPSRAQLVEIRGTRSIYHNNAIQTWRVGVDGEVHNVQLG